MKLPLEGVRVIEMAGIGPGPLAAMMLADMGAQVLRVDRAVPVELGSERPEAFNPLLRGRPTIRVDLKTPEAKALVLDLVAQSDALIEGFRPGVMERLGLGPDVCMARRPSLVYGRVTGWGQDGPLAAYAGHDMNYIALTGALHAIGAADGPPVPPLNLIGDYAGGTLYLIVGVLAALLSARADGKGKVVDAAMVDGALSLMTPFFGLRAAGLYSDQRGRNLLDGGEPYYSIYRCADGKYLSVAPIETRFREVFIAGLALPDGQGPELKPASVEAKAKAREIIANRLAQKTRDEWASIYASTDACVAPVLDLGEAAAHPHLAARGAVPQVDGYRQPVPAPRFDGAVPQPSPRRRDTPAQALQQWGLDPARYASVVS